MTIPMKRIREVAEVIMGTSPKGDTYNTVGEGLPLLNGPTEFGISHPECTVFTTDSVKECAASDLIFCVRGSTTGRMNWADRVYSLGRGVCAIRGVTDIDTKYIRYSMDYRLPALLQLAGGATFPNLPQDTIRDFEIPFPNNRAAIASTLCAYDDLIENNRRRMALLEEAARQLYREWFVRLRFPGHEHTRITDSVPEAWERVPLGDRVTLNYGKGLRTEDRAQGKYPVYGSSGIVGFHDKSLAQAPGIVVGRKGNVGSVYWCPKDYWPIDTVYFVDAETSNLWLFFALQQMHFISTDVAVPGLNRDFAYSRPLLVPEPRIVREFLDLAAPMYEQIATLDEMNEKLRASRDLLLPRLMSGEIAV